MFEPVHVSEAGQNVSCFAEVTIFLIVAPQEVHIVDLTLVLFDHMHQMFFQIRRIHLERKYQIKWHHQNKKKLLKTITKQKGFVSLPNSSETSAIRKHVLPAL